jgi:nitric oxide reductase subunit B
MQGTRKLWLSLAAVVVLSFAVLGYYGYEIYRLAPPVPQEVVTTSGQVVMTGDDIRRGQEVWQSTGGQELGSIWGHGSYHAPDWSADWLHREAVFILNHWAQASFGTSFDALKPDDRVLMNERLKRELRTNTYNPETGTLTISDDRWAAIQANSEYYSRIFTGDPSMADLREAYAMKEATIMDPDRMAAMSTFFFWTAWAAVTLRPDDTITYTNNWPADKLVGNEPASSLLLWTGFSVILLLAGIGALSAYYAGHTDEPLDPAKVPKQDPLMALTPTPSMRATLKYFWVVIALIVVQISLGIVTAHYGVEGTALYGIPLAEILPYSVTRTWHLQLGIFWIATSWLATGLFVHLQFPDTNPKARDWASTSSFSVCSSSWSDRWPVNGLA